ncbi:MAG: carboxypeptidase regulatory-like domain-containing protein [Myxococcales bacterium]|nr:carboxypeptidase regulatory-like domain-containing protein [Myxococcales bacterium]
MKIASLKAVLASGAVLVSGAAFAAGSIGGTVSFTGAPPKVEKLNRKSDPVCAKVEMDDPTITLSKDGKALANVLVRITKGAPDGKAPAEAAVINQKDCMYDPRVQGAVEGQKVQIKNSDGTLHNVHAYAGQKTLFNQAQPPKAKDIEKDLKGDVIRLKCDVHPWMTAYVLLSKHQFFATTGADGKFEIKDVPAGTYTVEAWHEKLGSQTAEVKVEDGKAADPKLAFGDKKT